MTSLFIFFNPAQPPITPISNQASIPVPFPLSPPPQPICYTNPSYGKLSHQ